MAVVAFGVMARGLWLYNPATAYTICGGIVFILCLWSAREG